MNSHPCFGRSIRMLLATGITTLTFMLLALAHAAGKTLPDVLAQTPELSTLSGAMQAAGLTESLSSAPTLTLLAPTNAAFKALPAGMLDGLLQPANKAQLVSLLNHHVLVAELDLEALKRKRTVANINGGTVKLALVNGELRIDHAHVQRRSFRTANGYIIVIDHVLLP